MAWALKEPWRFGDYYPKGEFVGLDEQRRRYFENLPPEARAVFHSFASYAVYASEKFSTEIGTLSGGTLPLSPIEPHEIPHTFRTEKSHSNLASLILSGYVAVDEQLKEIIERLEPGVHRFFPLQITMPRDRPYPKPYFILVVGQFLGGFLPDQTLPECWRRLTWSDHVYDIRIDSICCRHLAFSRSAIGGAHLWRARNALMGNIMISDVLRAEIAAAGLRIWKHWRVKEVFP